MKLISILLAALVLSFSINAMAMSDDDSLEFVDAITSGNMKIVKKYVEADAKYANEKSFAWSPIQMAANKNQLEAVKYLVSKGGDINYIHPLSHNTALHLAAFNGFDDMVKLLAASGADVNINTRSSNVRKLASFTAPEFTNGRLVEFFNFEVSWKSFFNQLSLVTLHNASSRISTSRNLPVSIIPLC